MEAKGEIAELADTINGMIETLATFADQVTDGGRAEVGRRRGSSAAQAKVPGAAGDVESALTENVNQLAERTSHARYARSRKSPPPSRRAI